MSNKIDYLTEDTPLSGQSFVCVSFLSNENVKNCNERGVKVRGVFATLDEANAHAKKLQQEDPHFHVFVGEVGKWLPFDPQPDKVKEQFYYEEKLQELMKKYLENREKTKVLETERKQQMLANSLKQSLEEKKKKKVPNKPPQVLEKEKEKNVENKLDDIKTTEENLKKIDEKLAKMKELYSKMKE
jgi:hypothetical protein